MSNFRVGQQVVCVDDNPGAGHRWNGFGPTKGHIYTVTSVHLSRDGRPTLWLAEIQRGATAMKRYGALVGYGQYRFRPVQYDTTKAVEAIKASLPKLKSREKVDS